MNAMTARFFADTNVVVYTLDADLNKRRAALSVMRTHPVISVQVINEFISVAIGKMKLHRSTANRLARILMKRCEVVGMSVETVSLAINLGERYQLSHWDSLIVASALDAGCDTLYSEDMQDGQVFEDRLKVNNPFVILA